MEASALGAFSKGCVVVISSYPLAVIRRDNMNMVIAEKALQRQLLQGGRMALAAQADVAMVKQALWKKIRLKVRQQSDCGLIALS